MVYQLFKNYSGIEKFENPEEEIEYYQDGTEEELIEYQTEVKDKVRLMVDEVKVLKTNLDSSVNQEVEVMLVELESKLNNLIEVIENKELSKEEVEASINELGEMLSTAKNMLSSDNNEDFNDEEADDEGNDEEGDDAEDAFVETDDNSEVVEGFQGNNNIIEYNLGSRKLLSLDLLLRSVLYACLFYILAHPDTFKLVGKVLKKVSKSNLLYVHMVVFGVVYYLLNLFI